MRAFVSVCHRLDGCIARPSRLAMAKKSKHDADREQAPEPGEQKPVTKLVSIETKLGQKTDLHRTLISTAIEFGMQIAGRVFASRRSASGGSQSISIPQPQDVSLRRRWERWMQDPALSGKEWSRILFKRMGDELPKMTITAAAKMLAEQSKLAVGSCKNLLRDTGLWERKPRGQLKSPRPRSK